MFVLTGDLLQRALTVWTPPRSGLALLHDHGEVHYDGSAYSLRQSRRVRNDSAVAHARYEAKVSVNHLMNDDPAVASAYHREHPLVDDDLGFRASVTRGTVREELSPVPIKHRDAQIDFALYFPEGRELPPGQCATIEHAYAVSGKLWGQWYQRNVRTNTERLSVEAHLPTRLEPQCWAMTSHPSRTGLEPLAGLVEHTSGDETIYSWDRSAFDEDLPQYRRVRLDWFFWRRILDHPDTVRASDVMRQFGILQVRSPERMRELPRHIPARDRIRPIDLNVASQHELALRILAHLRRVAGWVTRYHSFKPTASMGLAAPQLGIAYRIAIIKKSDSSDFVELLNPRVVAASSEVSEDYEGCLSFFDVRGLVARPASLTVANDQLDGQPTVTTFTGGLARSVQHEIDHLDGKLYTDADRMPAGARPIPVATYRAIRDRH